MPDDSNGRLSVISIDVHLTPGSEIQEFLDEAGPRPAKYPRPR